MWPLPRRLCQSGEVGSWRVSIVAIRGIRTPQDERVCGHGFVCVWSGGFTSRGLDWSWTVCHCGRSSFRSGHHFGVRIACRRHPEAERCVRTCPEVVAPHNNAVGCWLQKRDAGFF